MQKLSSLLILYKLHFSPFQEQNEFREKCKDDENYDVSITRTVFNYIFSIIFISCWVCWVSNFLKHPLGKKLLGKIGRVSSEEPPNTQVTITSTNGDPSENKQNGGLVGDYGGGVYGANFSGGNYGVYEAGRGTTGNDGPFGGRY